MGIAAGRGHHHHIVSQIFDRYLAAVASAGAPRHGNTTTEDAIQTVIDAVAPLTVPAPVQEAWLRFEASDWLVDLGEFQPPEFALQSWRMEVDGFGKPAHLFPVSYASHSYLYVELGMPQGPPGGPLLYGPIAEPLVRHAPSLEWNLEWLVNRLERGGIRWTDSWWSGADALEQEIRSAAAQEQWPVYLQATVDPASPLTWPAHWQRASGIEPSDAQPLGQTVTVREMLEMEPGDSCRIQGLIIGLASTGSGSHASVSDGSADAVVWVPRRSDPFSAVRIRQRVELDVATFEPIPASGQPAMFDEGSYRFRATMARPIG